MIADTEAKLSVLELGQKLKGSIPPPKKNVNFFQKGWLAKGPEAGEQTFACKTFRTTKKVRKFKFCDKKVRKLIFATKVHN